MMFTVDMKEKNSKQVQIKSITSRAMCEILKSIYTKEISFSCENFFEILHAASLMQFPNVINAAINYMQKNISFNNCFWFREHIMNDKACENLKDALSCFFLQKMEKVFVRPEYLNFSFEELDKIFSSDDLIVEEEKTIFDMLVKWTNADIENRKGNFPFLFQHIRLQFVPISYIISTVRKNKLVVQFDICRSLLEDVLSYHLLPSAVEAKHKQRKCFVPDTVMFVTHHENFQAIYDFVSSSWITFSSESLTNIAIYKDVAIAINHPISVLCGGISNQNVVQSSVVQFNGLCWKNLPSLIECGAAAALLENHLYVFGGEKEPVPVCDSNSVNGNSSRSLFTLMPIHSNRENFCNSFEKLDVAWSSDLCPIEPRSYLAAKAIGKKLFLIGGYKFCSSINKKEVCTDTIVFSPSKGTWKPVGSLRYARACFGCEILYSKIYVFGGKGQRSSYLNSIEVFEFTQKIWTYIADLGATKGFIPTCSISSGLYFLDKDKEKLLKWDKDIFEINRNVPCNGEGVLIPFSQSILFSNQPFTRTLGLTP